MVKKTKYSKRQSLLLPNTGKYRVSKVNNPLLNLKRKVSPVKPKVIRGLGKKIEPSKRAKIRKRKIQINQNNNLPESKALRAIHLEKSKRLAKAQFTTPHVSVVVRGNPTKVANLMRKLNIEGRSNTNLTNFLSKFKKL